MRKILGTLYVSLVALILWSGLAASASMSFGPGSAIPLQFTRSAPTVAITSMAWQDTVTIVSAADSVRTNNINTANWDWSGAWIGTSSGNVAKVVAIVIFYVPSGSANLAGGDSLTFAIEPSFDGGVTFMCNLNPLASAVGAHALGNNAVSAAGFGVAGLNINASAGLGSWYRGYIVADFDSAPTLAQQTYQLAGIRDFRLKIFGDAGAVGAVKGIILPMSAR